MALKQAIFDSLGEVRYTPDGTVGRQSRITVKLPFRKEVFNAHFRTLEHDSIPEDSSGNVDCYLTGNDLTCVLREGWASRCYNTSTETFVSFKEYVHLWWGYKERRQFDHSKCQRYEC